MTKYYTNEVFTPTIPARLAFVERETINQKLVNALRTPGKQIVVYGYSGSGKTTLLVNKLHQLYEDHITSRCMQGLTFEQLVLDAFDQLAPFYTSETGEIKKNGIDIKLSSDYSVIKGQIRLINNQDNSVKAQRILPPQLTPQSLARFMGKAKCCWVLEDFHKIDECERTKLSQIMKIFMDMADEYSTLKVIAIGAVDTARQVIEYDSEMRNRVSEIHVPLMNSDEIEEIITRGCQLLNLEFEKKLKTDISNYANGLASVCHHLCLNICTTQDINNTLDVRREITGSELDGAVKLYLEEASDTLKKNLRKSV
ncbi:MULTISPECIES: ATP-binding protein [Methylomonas]|nr:ATP-binding protein [Methylomonas koyamae]